MEHPVHELFYVYTYSLQVQWGYDIWSWLYLTNYTLNIQSHTQNKYHFAFWTSTIYNENAMQSDAQYIYYYVIIIIILGLSFAVDLHNAHSSDKSYGEWSWNPLIKASAFN